MSEQEKICKRSVLDTTIPGIVFDEKGICGFCKVYDELEKIYPLTKREEGLKELVEKIKKRGENKKYDCIVGVSGGTDSIYTLYHAVKLGLRPLAVHFDNGWNSKIAVSNIKNACQKLNVDLFTYVVDWEEFKDLQVSFLKASTSDADIPSDIGIMATLINAAAKENVKFVLNGHSFRTEFVMPIGWTYMDGKYIKSVHKKFGTKKLRSFPNFTLMDMVWYNIVRGIKIVPFLNYFDYQKEKAMALLKDELNWEYYGGHHHESTYTKFFQSYYLPKKFNIDKRKTELSAMVLSGHISRNEALKEIQANPYHFDQEVVDYTISKLGLSKEEFEKIMKSPVKSFHDYPTYFPMIKALKPFVKLAADLKLIPQLLYFKYLGH
ncbi:MAG: N-acetyl sugar amidotransferase [Bacteroidota bacterium]|nr:N-acetyl sugar amidotransferase [Bacteroidota bacterium]